MMKKKEIFSAILFIMVSTIFIFFDFNIKHNTAFSKEKIQFDFPSPTGYGEFPENNYQEKRIHVYYLSGNGNDMTGNGSDKKPWRSLNKVQKIMAPGDTIILRNGNYEAFHESRSNRTGWITFKADTRHKPVISKINIIYNTPSNAYLRFDGVEIKVTGSAKTFDVGVNLEKAKYFELRNCLIHNDMDNKYLTDYGVRTVGCSNILIYHNHMHSLQTANVILETSNITISRNHMHYLGGGDGVRWASKSKNGIIEMNNIYDSIWNPSDIGASSELPHSCAIQIRSNNVWIKKNIMHGIGTTAGIRMYPIDASGGESAYGNIIIENNLIYDTQNTTFIIENLGKNIFIRNNTIIGRLREDTNFGAARLHIAITVVSIANGSDGSGLFIHNNIIAGIAFTIPYAASIKNNIIWSFSYSDRAFNYISSLDTNKIVTSSSRSPIEYFTTNFFTGVKSESDFEMSYKKKTKINFLDYHLENASPAINYGALQYQSPESLGSVDKDGFIKDDGPTRDEKHHSAGCYEML